MSSNLTSNVISRVFRKLFQQAIDSRLTEELNAVLISYKIRPSEKELFPNEAAMKAHLDGYSDGVLNEYIIAKSKRWLETLQISDFVFPAHVYSLLWVIQLVQGRLGRPLRVLDFGGGAPSVPVMLHQLGMTQYLDSYRIIESPAFVGKIPAEWNAMCQYSDTYDGDSCDLLILSSVLPYLGSDLVRSVYRSIEKAPPQFIYFGRTSFLRDDYPEEEVYTVQESRFRDHGAQVDVGMVGIENNMAHYVKRHFKWSEIGKVLDPLGYRKVLELADNSGLENIKGLGLYSKNALWERAE